MMAAAFPPSLRPSCSIASLVMERNAHAAFVFDGHVAVNGAILYGNNSALDLIASGNVWDLFVANMTLVALITA